jgi:hypothetical protein
MSKFIPLPDDRYGMLHGLARHFLAVDLEQASAATADAAHVVEGERAEAETVIFEVELKGVLARCKGVGRVPPQRKPHAASPNRPPSYLSDVVRKGI